MIKLYSVEAMVEKDGRIYKGTLDFFNSKCILYNSTRIITEFRYDLKKAELINGSTDVLFLGLYTKEKSYIQIKYDQRISPRFILSDNDMDISLRVLRQIQKGENSSKEAHDSIPEEEDVDLIGKYDENVLSVFLNNPYRILGIRSNASNAEANESLEKIKRLDRLKVINSYKTEYCLGGFPAISRNLPGCQNALADLKDITHKWFWFNNSTICRKWQSEYYHSVHLTGTQLTYDNFLAKYLYALVFDNKFEHRKQWYDVFSDYQLIVGEMHSEILKEKLNKAESLIYDDEQLIRNFAEQIFKPIEIIIKGGEIESILRLFRTMRMDRFPSMREYKRKLGGTIVQWVISREKSIWNEIEEFIGVGKLDSFASEKVWKAAQEYDKSIQPVIENILNALTMEPVRTDMVKTSYMKVMEKVMVLLAAGERNAEAAKYGGCLYKYGDNQVKLKVLSICGLESIPGAIEDLPELMKSISQKKKNEMVLSSDFEDITLCKGSSALPRVDFCGIEFNNPSIGIRFWVSNTTEIILKLWLMDISVNGEECFSTEVLCEVQAGKCDFYTYELSVPEKISYDNINSISFYIEIDKPKNNTIYDTEIVSIKCNTITDKFSVAD